MHPRDPQEALAVALQGNLVMNLNTQVPVLLVEFLRGEPKRQLGEFLSVGRPGPGSPGQSHRQEHIGKTHIKGPTTPLASAGVGSMTGQLAAAFHAQPAAGLLGAAKGHRLASQGSSRERTEKCSGDANEPTASWARCRGLQG